jgi:drug/metabolite transporter (DMT)-like permease
MLCGSFSFTLMAVLATSLLRVEKVCDWQTVAVFRAGLVALFGAVLTRLTGGTLIFWPWRLWVRSLAGSLSMVCTFFAFAQLPVADVVTLTNTFPIWVAFLSWPLYRHFPGGKIVAAILVGVLGVALVEQPHFASGNLGVPAALAAALFTAVAMLGLHSLGNLDPRAIVVHFSAVATVVCGIAFLVTARSHDPARVLEWKVLWKLLGMGATALVGQMFLTLAFAAGAPAKVSVVGLTQIVFALAFDVFLFGHEVNEYTLLGTALVIAPTAWLLTRSRARPADAPKNDSLPEHEIGSPADSTITPSLPS